MRVAGDAARYYEQGYWREPTILDDFRSRAAEHPHKAAIVTYRGGGAMPVTVTYGQLASAVDRIADGLLELGVGRGDVVSVQLPNGWEFAAVALATMQVGAIVNPLVAIFRRRELEFMLRRAGSVVLFVPDEFRGFSHSTLAAELRAELPGLRHAVVVGQQDRGSLPPDVLGFDDHFLRREQPVASRWADVVPRGADEIVSLMYTSGTTGEPKGTLHTTNTLRSAGNPLFNVVPLDSDDVCFMASTLGHLTGFLWGMLQPLTRGMKIVFQDVWDPAAFVRLVAREGITWTLSATPFAVDAVNAQVAAPQDLGSFRFFLCAGAPIPSSLPARATEVLGARLVSLWGTSECGICSIQSPDDPLNEISTNDGRPTPVMDVRIVGENGRAVPDGEPGRLLSRGASLFVGYIGRPDLFASVVDADGWFDTGDLGYRTPSGGLRICGRSKDIIVRGGENVPVVEVENVLFTHPNVRDVAVVGYPDERLGERACAIVVPDGPPPALSDLTTFLAERGMAKQYWPERLELRTELPRTPSGKVQKYKIRDELEALAGKTVFDPVS
jgi:cyclohexanecarboxylate-CoA ligase